MKINGSINMDKVKKLNSLDRYAYTNAVNMTQSEQYEINNDIDILWDSMNEVERLLCSASADKEWQNINAGISERN